jgi:hypothetical protein
MTQVREEHITNERVRKMFFNIPDVRNLIIAASQLNFLGKTMRHPSPDHIPKLLASAWINNKRPPG